MTPDDFNILVGNRIDKCRNTLVEKGEEYSRDGDRLWNFYRAAVMDGQTPERALFGMWKKHLVSIMDIIDEIDRTGCVPSKKVIDEKFGDSHNYEYLLEGLIEDRREIQDSMVRDEYMDKITANPLFYWVEKKDDPNEYVVTC